MGRGLVETRKGSARHFHADSHGANGLPIGGVALTAFFCQQGGLLSGGCGFPAIGERQHKRGRVRFRSRAGDTAVSGTFHGQRGGG